MITLEHSEKFQGNYRIPEEKLKDAVRKACDKLAGKIDLYTDGFPLAYYKGYKYLYRTGENDNWVCGMHTGCFLLAWELTGDEKFLEVARHHMESYKHRAAEKIEMQDHDVGFVFSPSCVGYYRLTGDEEVKKAVLEAADYFYHYSYSKKGGFILRQASAQHLEGGCRTMMDTMLNIPMLYWAGQETGNTELIAAADAQAYTTDKYLIRQDGSTYHHYQFDVETHAPVRGLTFQGNRDESTWTRGHAWGILGYAIAYAYTGNREYLRIQKELICYFLNHLPQDLVPYWDFDFCEGEEPRDSSAGLIAACGMMESARILPEDAPEKEIYQNAAARILEAVIDHCTGDIGTEYDGLVHRVTGARKANLGVDGCATYGDYFYLEALLRYIKPDWNRYW